MSENLVYRLVALAALIVLFRISEGCSAAASVGDADPPAIDFRQEILPLLTSRCVGCHGPDVQEGRLRLDRRSSILRGGDSGEPAILPGNSADSHLIHLVTGQNAGKRMPPDESDRLSDSEIRLLRLWIDQGGEWPGSPDDEPGADSDSVSDHWSFRPVTRPKVPVVPEDAEWVRNPIDSFIAMKLREHGLSPASSADNRTLIRRLHLDMLGLPPSPESIRTFTAHLHDTAYDQLVEDVLASPHYGERWASYWLDLVRFGETNGFETNRERPNAWPFRDYVIRSLNEDKPYDVFLREQIAGDAMGVPEGTAYLVAGPYDLVKSPDLNLTLMQRQNELDDIIGTTGTAFLGLTVGCARCHNHKFDPIRQTDYYAMQAVFAGVQHGERQLPVSVSQEEELRRVEREIVRLRRLLSPFLKSPSASRPSVSARGNEELFEETPARLIRFTIEQTNSSEPCIDELEIFSGVRNVALSSEGAIATCSSSLPGYEIHRLEHINDGQYGNSRSWISNEPGGGWVQIELPEITRIDRILWARDREGRFGDRVATRYRIEVATAPDAWTLVASSADRLPFADTGAKIEYEFASFPQSESEQGRRWLVELESLERTAQRLKSMAVYAGNFEQPGPTHRLFRGEPGARREQVGPDTLEAFGRLHLPVDAPEQQRRVALANWIASRDNPLTARVIVNRLWQYHFGKGLVATPGDFGRAGTPPAHPELLDWLAAELMDHDWSLKHIHRLILTSATYRQPSQPDAQSLQTDASTELWWRFPPRRLEAEVIRDSILSVTGTLDRTMFGPGFSGFEVELENVRHYFPKKQYGPEDWRRMVYMTRVRLERESVFGIFDCPDGATSVSARSRSTTPLQALNLFNSAFLQQQSDLFAKRLRRETPNSLREQVSRAFELCYGRLPSDEEVQESAMFAEEQGLEAFCRAILNSNEFVFLF